MEVYAEEKEPNLIDLSLDKADPILPEKECLRDVEEPLHYPRSNEEKELLDIFVQDQK